MTDNIRYQINIYIQLLKYVDDANEKRRLVNEIENLLESVPISEQSDIIVEENENYNFYDNPVRDVIREIVKKGFVNQRLSATQIFKLAEDFDMELDTSREAIGIFIRKYRGYLATEDDICVTTVHRGTGSNLYIFSKLSHGKPSPTKESCMETIIELFSDTNSIDALDITNMLKEKGFSISTIRRAKESLGIKSIKKDGKDGKWTWLLKENKNGKI